MGREPSIEFAVVTHTYSVVLERAVYRLEIFSGKVITEKDTVWSPEMEMVARATVS